MSFFVYALLLQNCVCGHMIIIMQKSFLSCLETIPHQTLRYAAGQMIVDMDDEVAQLFAVHEGMVHLVRFREDGGVAVLQRAGAGAVVAEASVFSGRYHCAAMAVRGTVLHAYPLAAVRRLLESPQAAQAYALHMAAEVRVARKRAEILALKTVAERLSAWLVWNGGEMPARGAWQHVADEISVSREALYRELAKRR